MDENSTELMDYNSDESDPVKANSCQVFMHIDDVNIGKLKIELQTHVPHENLSDYEVWLQNSKKLDQSYRLADDCTTSGLVQIDVEISFVKKQTTIRDVIQPSEEMIRFNEPKHVDQSIDTNDVACVANFMEKLEDNKLTDIPVPDKVDSPLVEDTKNVTVPKFVKRIRQNPVEFPGRKNKVQRVDQSGTNNKNVQLWTFLLELLTSRECVNIIQWVGNDGTFRLIDRTEVARLWGVRKNKKNMCYGNLSRSLRAYYVTRNPIITKVGCERNEYRFTTPIKTLIGYEPDYISDMVNGRFQRIRRR